DRDVVITLIEDSLEVSHSLRQREAVAVDHLQERADGLSVRLAFDPCFARGRDSKGLAQRRQRLNFENRPRFGRASFKFRTTPGNRPVFPEFGPCPFGGGLMPQWRLTRCDFRLLGCILVARRGIVLWPSSR